MRGTRALLFLLFVAIILLCISESYRRRSLEHFTVEPYILPRTIYTHWHDSNYPPYLEKNIENWRKVNPGWQVEFFTTDSFLATLPNESVPPGFKDLRLTHQSDWIRLKLLKDQGGIWMDSGILLNSSLQSLYDECEREKADLLLFKVRGLQTNEAYPVGESWFLMAPQNSSFMAAWFEEFDSAVRMGLLEYKKLLREEGIDLQRIYGGEEDIYLTIHACFQRVIQKKMPSAKIVYHVAEDSMFKVQADCQWKKDCIRKTLEDVETVRKIPYVKLRGDDRPGVDIHRLISG